MKYQGGIFGAIFLIAFFINFFSVLKVQAITPSDLVISKIQITGGTGLTTHDFVSIYNKTDQALDLEGLRLVKRTKTGTTDTTLKSWTTSTIINSGAYYTWANTDIASTINADTSSSQTISNDNGIAIRQGAENTGEIIDSIGWGSAANDFVEASPFSTNPIGGQYLERINNQDTNDNSVDFQIYPPIIEEEEPTQAETNNLIEPIAKGKDIIVNELFINPKDIDNQAREKEFIELYNQGKEAAKLDGWRLEIGELVFILPYGTILGPGSFTTIRDPKNIPLPNNGATIKLFAPERVTAKQTITYKAAPDGMAWANFSSAWRWTAVATPNSTNILAQAPTANFEILGILLPNVQLRFDSSDSFVGYTPTHYLWEFGNGETSAEPYPEYSFTKAGKYKISLTIKNDYGSAQTSKTITIANIKSEPDPKPEEKIITDEPTENKSENKSEEINNKDFTLAGTAVCAPGNFSSQSFYLLPEYGEPLYEIYNSKKLFPKIKIGDQLIITGEYTENEAGPRLKTKDSNNIKIIGQTEIKLPALTSSSQLKLPPYPRLALIEGEIVSKKSPRLILADNEGEIEIYFSTGSNLKTSDFNVGEKISVLGILTNDNNLRLEPRNKTDIKINHTEEITIASLEPQTNTITLEKNVADETTNKEDKKSIFIYLISGGIIIISFLLYFMFKNK